MRTLALLALLTVATLAFAGCTGGKGNGTSSSSSSSHSASGSVSASVSVSASASGSASGSHSSSGSSTGPANHAPVGSISASVGNGSLPLKVNFTMGGSDADGDKLTWDLAFGDGNKTSGTTLPATTSHSYTKTGNFTAIYVVTDGKTPMSYNVTIKVAGAGASKPTVSFTGTVTASDPFAAGGQGCTYAALHILPAPFPDNFGYLFNLPTTVGGWSFAFDPAAGMEADFIDAAGNVPASGASGTVPAEATQVAVCGADPMFANQDFTLLLTAP